MKALSLPFSLSFTSLGYLLCLGILCLLQRLLPRKLSPLLLLAASILFYFCMMPAALPIVAVFVCFVYLGGFLLAKPSAKRGKFAVLFIGGTILFLLIFKYLPWAAEGITGRGFSLILPLGISYFTFSAISYLVDVYKGKIPAQKSFLDLSLYILFFPKITAGPIERPDSFFASLRRMEDPANPLPREDSKALLLLLSGFLRKLAVSDLLAPAVAAVFDAPGDNPGGFSLCLAAFLFAWQLYGDFAGYTDIARGSALLLGVPLPENFDSPYAAKTIREFWRRWHISLSSFLRDYIYIPLGGSRAGNAKKQRNLLITFLVSGLWHGASLPYVLWGALHGLLQILENLLEPIRRRLTGRLKKGEHSLLYRIPATILTFLLVDLCWIVFRAATLRDLGRLLASLGHMGDLSAAWRYLGLSLPLLLTVCAALLLSKLLHLYLDAPERFRSLRQPLAALPLLVALVLGVGLLLLYAAHSGGGGEFIYVAY